MLRPGVEVVAAADPARCPRCGPALHARKPQSLQRTWACSARRGGALHAGQRAADHEHATPSGRESHTHRSAASTSCGIDGSWDLAMIVFVASIAVPMLKIAALALLAWSVRGAAALAPARAGAPVSRRSRRSATGRCSTSTSSCCSAAWCASARFASVEPGPGLLAFAARRRADHARRAQLRSRA